MNLRTPERLLEALADVLPEFLQEWEAGEVPSTFHEVILRFTPFFGCRAKSFSPDELKRVGTLINDAVAEGGVIENAVSTCFLEHLRQIDAWRALKAYLSDRARRKSR
jgi:hypothetical protein